MQARNAITGVVVAVVVLLIIVMLLKWKRDSSPAKVRKEGAASKTSDDQRDDNTLPPESPPRQGGNNSNDIENQANDSSSGGSNLQLADEDCQTKEFMDAKGHDSDAIGDHILAAGILKGGLQQTYDGNSSEDEALFGEIMEAMVVDDTPSQRQDESMRDKIFEEKVPQEESQDHTLDVDCVYEGVDYSEDDGMILPGASDTVRKRIAASHSHFLRPNVSLLPLTDVEEEEYSDGVD